MKPKIITARLHQFAFLAGTQLGPELSSVKGTRKVELEIVDDTYLQVTYRPERTTAVYTALIPLTNVAQLEVETKEIKK